MICIDSNEKCIGLPNYVLPLFDSPNVNLRLLALNTFLHLYNQFPGDQYEDLVLSLLGKQEPSYSWNFYELLMVVLSFVLKRYPAEERILEILQLILPFLDAQNEKLKQIALALVKICVLQQEKSVLEFLSKKLLEQSYLFILDKLRMVDPGIVLQVYQQDNLREKIRQFQLQMFGSTTETKESPEPKPEGNGYRDLKNKLLARLE